MAYRREVPGELCARCNGPAPAACVRCGQPYCDSHAPPADRRCDPCESDYLASETRSVRRLVVAVLMLGGAMAFFGVIATHAARNGYIRGPNAHLAPIILFASLAVLAGAFAIAPLLKRYLRRAFLGERAHHGKGGLALRRGVRASPPA